MGWNISRFGCNCQGKFRWHRTELRRCWEFIHCGSGSYQFWLQRCGPQNGRKLSEVISVLIALHQSNTHILISGLPSSSEFQAGFNGNNWGNNGPGVITRVLQNVCGSFHTTLMTRDRCKFFNVFPVKKVYAIRWQYWRFFFSEKFSELALNMTSDSIAVHVWNKFSSSYRIPAGSKAAYSLLAAKYCPKVFKTSGNFFWYFQQFSFRGVLLQSDLVF